MAKKETIFIYGKHALVEALQNVPKAIEKVFLSSDSDKEINDLLLKNKMTPSKFSGDNKGIDIERDASHQGIVAKISLEKLILPYNDFIDHLKINKDTSLVLLAGLQDPHNVGAIIRSAAAFGSSGVIIPAQNQSPITGAVVKSSAGMAFRMPIVSINNINETIKDLKNRGFNIYGLEGESRNYISSEEFSEPSVFVMGNESKGIEKETIELCNKLISIPMDPRCESLNVAAAAAVALYSWSLKHKFPSLQK